MGIFIHETSYVDDTANIGNDTKNGILAMYLKHAKIGKNCVLGQNVNIGTNVCVGNFCKIQNNVSIYEGVELEDYVFCGPSMVFTNIHIPRCKYPQADSKNLPQNIN